MKADKTHEKEAGEASEEKTTESVEEYLESLCRLSEKGEKLTTTTIARELKVSPASVSEMLKRLSSQGYVKHAPYKEIALTEKGRKVGGRTLRKHRVIEGFLDRIGLPRKKIHDEACRLEHYVSDELEDRLRETSEPGKVRGIVSLEEMGSGRKGRVVSIEAGRGASRRLLDMGLTPGTPVEVRRAAPFSGPIEIRVRDSCLVIGRGMARKVFLEVGD